MTETGDFDQNEYWVERHRRLRGDPRSVGNLGKTIEQNKSAEKRIQYWMAHSARELKPYASVLDIGCGYGRVASAFCDEGYDYTGIDISSIAVEAARKNEARGSYLVGSPLNTDFGREYDLVCVLYVFIHFVDDQEWLQLISKVAAMLTPGGGLLFADAFPEKKVRPVPHVCQRPLSLYEQAFETCGMKLDPSFRVSLGAALRTATKLPSAYLARRVT